MPWSKRWYDPNDLPRESEKLFKWLRCTAWCLSSQLWCLPNERTGQKISRLNSHKSFLNRSTSALRLLLRFSLVQLSFRFWFGFVLLLSFVWRVHHHPSNISIIIITSFPLFGNVRGVKSDKPCYISYIVLASSFAILLKKQKDEREARGWEWIPTGEFRKRSDLSK